MDLSHSEQDEEFRRELRAWLDANLPQEMRTSAFWADKSEDEQFQIRREWEAGKAAAAATAALAPGTSRRKVYL